MKHTYDDGDHTKREMRELEKSVLRLAQKYESYYHCVQRTVDELNPRSKFERMQLEFDAMMDYDQSVGEI